MTEEKYTDEEYQIIGLMALGKWIEAAELAEKLGQPAIILVMQRAHEIGFNEAMSNERDLVESIANESMEDFGGRMKTYNGPGFLAGCSFTIFLICIVVIIILVVT